MEETEIVHEPDHETQFDIRAKGIVVKDRHPEAFEMLDTE